MRQKEDYSSYVLTALILTIAIIVIFQIYIFREPARIEADLKAENQHQVAEGSELYAENCIACHGESGQGGVGPALNSRPLLAIASDQALFNLTVSGVPGTIMPAWGQFFGGPFTDEQVLNLVAFIRAWEPNAPEPALVGDALPNATSGAAIYVQTCFICHGDNGEGSDFAPALRDAEKLARFEDSWYRQTISFGRPARGMPTWGTVLSPAQINDLVALISAWREGEDVIAEIPYTRYMINALFALRQFDREDAAFFLNAALKVSDSSQASGIQDILILVEDNRLFEAEAALISLLPPDVMGQALFDSNCAACHGADGSGELGPSLLNNSFIQTNSDEDIISLILRGRSGTAMNGFSSILLEDDLVNLITLLQSWQE